MKPLWVQTLIWLAAVVAALVLAFAVPDGSGDDYNFPAGATVPR